MKKSISFHHLLVFYLVGTAILTGCSGSSGSAIDDLFGSTNSAPILTSIPDQIVSQTDLLHIDLNNIKEGQPGSDEKMSYACYYDSVADGTVEATNTCATIPSSTVTFDATTGILDWTPGSGILGNYEIRVVGTNTDGVYSEIFTVGVRLKFNGVENITAITGTSVTMTWTPNAAASGYQVFKLNTITGQYEHLWTVNGGANSGTTVTGLVPNTPFTVRVQSIDILGHFDGNVVSRSFTTTSLVQFSMAATSTNVTAGTSTTVTVQAYNADGSPQTVGGLVLTPNIQSGSSVGTFSSVTDNNNGTYTFTFNPTVVGTPAVLEISTNMTFFLQNTISVTVAPGPASSANSSISISSNSVVSGQTATVSATIRDAYMNPISSGVTVSFVGSGGSSTGSFSSVTNLGSGQYSSTFTGLVAGTTKTLFVQVDTTLLTPSTTVTVIPGAPVSVNSTLAVSSSTVQSGNSVTVTATLKDINNNPVPSGILVSFSKAGGTSTGSFGSVTNAGSGQYQITYTGLASGTAQTLGVSVDGTPLSLSQTIQVIPGAPNIGNSSLNISSSTITSGSFATVTANIRDVNNNPIESGITVTFSKTGGTSTGTFTNLTNQSNGVYTVRYNGVTAGTAQTIQVLIDGVALGSLSTTVAVNPGSPSPTQSTISVASSTVISGNDVLVTAVIRDDNNNPISSGYSIAFSKTGGTSTGTFSSVTNAGSGTYTVLYTGVGAGTAQTLGVSVDGSPLGPTTSIAVLPGSPSSLLSTLTVSAGTVIAGQTVTMTATIKDANSNPISSGILVGFDQLAGGTSFGNISSVVNQGNGVYTATFTGVTAGTAKTVQATVGGAGFGPTQSIQVLVGAPVAANSSLSFATSPLASGATGTISATIRDSQNNPITTQYAITFDAIGGSSTGTVGSTSNLGSGQFQASYTGAIAGSAQTLRVLADGVPISGLTATVQVVAGPVDVSNSTFISSASTVQSGTTANFTIQLKDINNNSITNATVTFNKTAGVSNGNITGATHTSNGNYPAVYTATTQGSAQTVTLVVNGTAIPAMAVSLTVTAGPPTDIQIAGPANPLNSIDCNGPYTVTLKDASSNTTSSLSTVSVALSSTPANSHNGTIFSDSSCVSAQTSLSFAPLQSSTTFYYKSFLPQTISLTLTPAGGIAANSVSIQNIPVVSWIGSAATFTMNGSGNGTVMDDRGGGQWQSYGVTIRGDYLFAIDYAANRIMKYNIDTNTFVGWIGHIGSLEGISAGCAANVLGDLTPTWCTGGRSSPATSTILYQPRGIASDATYIYVASNNRILRFRQDDGSYQGWIGRVNTVIPPSGGSQLATCVSPTTSTGTPGWCIGGNFTSGTGNGQFNTPSDIVVVNTKMFVTDYSNHRVQKFDVASGAFEGWIGRVGTVPTGGTGCATLSVGDPTPGWCTGGTAQVSNRYNLQVTPTETVAPPEGFQNPLSIDGNASYLYIADYSNRRVVRVDTASGSFQGWIGRIYRGNSASNTTSPVAGNNIYSPTWTTGGTTQETGGTTGFCAVTGVRVDASYIYLTDICHRVVRVDIADGQNYRWIGRVSTSPTGGFVGCSSTPISGVTPGWCLGGAGNRVGNTNLAFYNPQGLAYSGNTMYVTDMSNFRIQKVDKTTGEFLGWIGAGTTQGRTWTRTPAAQFARAGIDDYSVADMTGGWAAVAISGNHMFSPDPSMHRIKRFNLLDGSMIGYVGQISIFPPVGPDTCVGYTSGMTPDWCTGGGRTTSGTGIHGYNAPYGLGTDGTYVYVANYSNERVDRIRISDALYMGWIGKINVVPTDGDPACLTANTGDPAPGWCIGGTASAGNADGNFNAPRNIFFDSALGKLFVVGNGRVSRIDPSSGAFEGAIGHLTAGTGCTIAGATASGWCTSVTGGTGTNNYGGMNNGTGIATNSTYIFISDIGNHRILRFVKATGTPAGFLGRLQNATNLDVSVTGMKCQGLSASPAYPKSAPGWCKGTNQGVALTVPGVSADEGSFNSPRGIWADDTYVYVADTNNNRIVRLDADDGEFQGWKGYIATTTGMTGACLAAGPGGITPTWCFGGTPGPGTTLGGFDFPTGLAGDANYLYVHDGRNNRIVTIPRN